MQSDAEKDVPLNEEQSALLASVLHLVDPAAAYHAPRAPEFSMHVLRSEAHARAVEATRKHDPNKGPFESYAWACMVRGVGDFIRKERLLARRFPSYDGRLWDYADTVTAALSSLADDSDPFMDGPADNAARIDRVIGGVSLMAIAHFATAEESMATAELRSTVREVVADLSEPLRTILTERWLNERPAGDVAKDLDKSDATFRRDQIEAFARAEAKLRARGITSAP